MKELRPPPACAPDAPLEFTSSRMARFRYRGLSTDGRAEWMALWTPGWQPRPLTIEEARQFMARRPANG